MIGLREDQQERALLVSKINTLFPVWRRAVVASPLTTTIGLTTGEPSGLLGRRLGLLHRRPLADLGVPRS
jgi:hypothetical protein